MIYSRTISVRRARTVAGTTDAVGDVGYSGDVASTAAGAQGEDIIFSNIPCSIQALSPGYVRGMTLPQDVVHGPKWAVFIPSAVVTKGSIRDRDILVDDEGYRYGVAQAWWDLHGYSLTCIREEA